MSAIEDQINESVHGYDDECDENEDVLTTEQELIDQLTDRNCELCDEIEDVRLENADLLADIERLKGILREFLRWDEGVKGTYLTRMQLVKLAREALGIDHDAAERDRPCMHGDTVKACKHCEYVLDMPEKQEGGA